MVLVLEYDDLTGLYIRQAFFHHAKTLMRFNTNQDFGVVVADIKNLNGSMEPMERRSVIRFLLIWEIRIEIRFATGRWADMEETSL